MMAMPQNMMVSGSNAVAMGNLPGEQQLKMKHNNSNQSIHSQKKIQGGINVIRKPPGNTSLENSFVTMQGGKNYKYMSPYAKNMKK